MGVMDTTKGDTMHISLTINGHDLGSLVGVKVKGGGYPVLATVTVTVERTS